MSFTKEQEKKLLAPLDTKRLATRRQGGKELSYLEAWDVIATANDIFGLDGWQRGFAGQGVRQVAEREFMNENRKGFEVAYICEYFVQVGDQRAEDVGYGNATSYRSALDAHELAVKEAVSDALKRCWRSWGNQFGNSLYDKDKTQAADTHNNEDDQDAGAGQAATTKGQPAAAGGNGEGIETVNGILIKLAKQKKKGSKYLLEQAQQIAKSINEDAPTTLAAASHEVKLRLIKLLEEVAA